MRTKSFACARSLAIALAPVFAEVPVVTHTRFADWVEASTELEAAIAAGKVKPGLIAGLRAAIVKGAHRFGGGLALVALCLLAMACGGAVEQPAPACTQSAEACAYLAYLAAHVHGGVVDCDARSGVQGAACAQDAGGEAGAPSESSAQ